MNVRFKCSVVLSKKLRQLIGNKDTSLTLIVKQATDGQGEGILSLSTPGSINIPNGFMGEETSIQLKTNDIEGMYPDENNVVGNIFSGQERNNDMPRNAVDRLAAEKVSDNVSEDIVTRDEIAVPDEFATLNEPECSHFVSNLQEFISAVNKAKHKESNINLSRIEDKRKKALAQEEKEMKESIDGDAYIVNRKCASLTINDMDRTLPLNQPINFGNISAKKIAQSSDLLGLLKSGMLEIVSPEEASRIMEDGIRQQKNMESSMESEVFDSRYEAQDAIEGKMGFVDRVNVDDDDGITEEQELIMQTGVGGGSSNNNNGLPTRRFSNKGMSNGGNPFADTTLAQQTAGLTNLSGSKHVPSHSKQNTKGIKTISRSRS